MTEVNKYLGFALFLTSLFSKFSGYMALEHLCIVSDLTQSKQSSFTGVKAMSETFCIRYQDIRTRRPVQKISMAYPSRDLALNAAFLIKEKDFDLLEIRGSEGSLLTKIDLEKALCVATA